MYHRASRACRTTRGSSKHPKMLYIMRETRSMCSTPYCQCSLCVPGIMESAFISLALDQAKEAFGAGEVPIGCVIVEDASGQILGRGRNMTNETYNATRHAEMVAIDRALEAGKPVDWSAASLYVTVEPCVMCAAALRLLGLTKVFFASHNERFGGCGSLCNAHQDFMGPAVPALQTTYLTAYRAQAVMLLRRFYMRENERAPKPKAKKNRVLKELEE